MKEYIYIYNKEFRIDSYIATLEKDLSRSYIQKLIKNENILVNNKSVKTNYKLKYNDIIYIDIPENIEIDIVSQDIKLDILYEDEYILVVNKPQDMVVHPAPGNYTGTLVNALMYHCKDKLSGINGVLRPGIVHRIDKDTSGILVVAKNDIAHRKLTEQFKLHTINRRYEAIVYGNIKEDIGDIDLPIGRNPKDRKKMAVTYKNSKKAITHFKVLERFKKFTYIEASLETGRTHQIRVHMSHIGHPLLGDPLYGPKNNKTSLNKQVLHAKSLGFIHPYTNEYIEFNKEHPIYFEDLLNKFRRTV